MLRDLRDHREDDGVLEAHTIGGREDAKAVDAPQCVLNNGAGS